MELKIDGDITSVDVSSLNTFEELLYHIETELVRYPRVVTRVILNEEPLDESQEVGLGAFPVSEIISLEVETQTQTNLAHEALEDAQKYIPEISAVLEESAKMIREGKVEDGLRFGSEALGIIGEFGQVLEGIRVAFQIDFSQVKIDEYTLLDKLNDLGRLAREILNAANQEKWEEFADIMEYDLSPLLYEWMAVLPSLVELLPSPEGLNNE